MPRRRCGDFSRGFAWRASPRRRVQGPWALQACARCQGGMRRAGSEVLKMYDLVFLWAALLKTGFLRSERILRA
jgi:hypothetical protein